MSNYRLPTTGTDFCSSVNPWERSDIPGLTLFDLNCKPRVLSEKALLASGGSNKDTITISIEKLNKIFDNDFKCPICLETIDQTATVTACLHRFCSECIQKSLRMPIGADKRHECPSCRAKLASRRASKPDTQFDALMQLLTVKNYQPAAEGSVSPNSPVAAGGGGGGGGRNNARTSASTGAIEGDTTTAGTSPRATRTYKYDKTVSSSAAGTEKMDLTPYWRAHQNKINEFKAKQREIVKKQQKQQRAQLQNEQSKRARLSQPTTSDNSGSNGATVNGAALHGTNGTTTIPAGIDPTKVLFGLFPLQEWLSDPRNISDVQRLSSTSNADLHPGTCTLRSPYLRVPSLLKIGDLKQYIKKKYLLPHDLFQLLEIIAKYDNRMIILDEYLTLRDVAAQFWDTKGEFLLHFRLYKEVL